MLPGIGSFVYPAGPGVYVSKKRTAGGTTLRGLQWESMHPGFGTNHSGREKTR